jgi:hypothetical protein
MTILPGVVKAEHRGDYRIYLTFNDGTSKTVDFQPWLAPETLYAATDIRQVA